MSPGGDLPLSSLSPLCGAGRPVCQAATPLICRWCGALVCGRWRT